MQFSGSQYTFATITTDFNTTDSGVIHRPRKKSYNY